MPAARIWLPALCALSLAACGEGDGGPSQEPPRPGADPPSSGEREPPERAGPLDLPRQVPRAGRGPAEPEARRVIAGWLRALREGDIARAASFWALRAKAQNGTPVLTLATRGDILRFNASLPCGAALTGARRAPAGFTVTSVRLTERPGGACGSGIGDSARTAIRVRRGRIVEWYRLADDPGGAGPGQAPRGGPIV